MDLALSTLMTVVLQHLPAPSWGLLARALAVWLGVSAALWATTWLHYLAIMSLERALQANTLHGAARGLAMLVVGAGLASDAALNWWFLTPATLHVAPHWLVTQHLGVLMTRSDWRGRMARYLCTVWLDPFDPTGCHCHPRLR